MGARYSKRCGAIILASKQRLFPCVIDANLSSASQPKTDPNRSDRKGPARPKSFGQRAPNGRSAPTTSGEVREWSAEALQIRSIGTLGLKESGDAQAGTSAQAERLGGGEPHRGDSMKPHNPTYVRGPPAHKEVPRHRAADSQCMRGTREVLNVVDHLPAGDVPSCTHDTRILDEPCERIYALARTPEF